MNYMSRKFEYEADDFAKTTYKPEPLISSLKKLSKKLSKDEIDLLSKMLKHFLPKISQLVSESTSFRQKAKDWETKLRKQNYPKKHWKQPKKSWLV